MPHFMGLSCYELFRKSSQMHQHQCKNHVGMHTLVLSAAFALSIPHTVATYHNFSTNFALPLACHGSDKLTWVPE